jgi:uncharacterized membrane protein
MGKDQQQLEILAAVYRDDEGATTILDMLEKMHRASTVILADAAKVTKSADGKLHIKETREVTTGKGARRGALVTGIFGLIYPPSLLVSALTGGIIGGAWGKLRDTGVKTDKMRELGDTLEPGNVGVIVLADRQWAPEIQRAMEGYPGQFIRHEFTPEETAQIQEADASSG